MNTIRLCKDLDYRFKNAELLRQALTHCSVGAQNNERLEFLGDSILNMVIAQELYARFPQMNEGELSRLRAHLVCGETLADIANALNLGHYLFLGPGELRSGGFRRASILSDALEAIFAAVFLDSDFSAAQNLVVRLFLTRLQDPALYHRTIKDAKTELQEWLQAQKHPLPQYVLFKTSGEEHEQEFFVRCEIPKLDIIEEGQGQSRRKAEQEAAKKCLHILQKKMPQR